MRVNFYDKYLKEQQANKTTINTAVASVFVQKGSESLRDRGC